MKLKLSNIYIAFIILLLSFSIYGQQANNWTYVPNNLDDAIKHLKKSIHPAVQKEWIAKSQEELENNTNFESLVIYISEKWLTPNSKLLSYMKINSKRNNAHAKNILLAFHHYLNNPDENLQIFLTSEALTSKFLPPSIVLDNPIKISKFLLQGYNVYNFPICDDANPINFNYFEKNKKIQLVTKLYEIIPNMIFDGIDNMQNSGYCDFIKIQVGNKLGLINNNGKIILKPVYDCIEKTSHGFKVKNNNLWTRLDVDEETKLLKEVPLKHEDETAYTLEINGNESSIISCECESIEDLNSKDLVDIEIYEINRKIALVEVETGKEIYPINRDLHYWGPMESFKGTPLVVAYRRNGKKGWVNLVTNKEVIPFEYDDLDMQSLGYGSLEYFQAKRDGKWGLISTQNEVKLPFLFDRISYISVSRKLNKKIVTCSKNDKWGFIDLEGNMIIPFIYEDARDIFEDKLGKEYFICKNNGKYGAVDSTNLIKVPFNYEHPYQVKDTVNK